MQIMFQSTADRPQEMPTHYQEPAENLIHAHVERRETGRFYPITGAPMYEHPAHFYYDSRRYVHIGKDGKVVEDAILPAGDFELNKWIHS